MLRDDGFLRVKEVDVARRRVFVRADLDCPTDASGTIIDDTKLLAAGPTLAHLLEAEAQVVVAGHRRAVSGKIPSLEACAARLAELLGAEVFLPDESLGLLSRKLIHELRPGRLVMLENLLREKGESEGDMNLAKRLLDGVEVFVGDCLAGPHHFASIAHMPRLIAERAIGLRMEQELMAANRLRNMQGKGFVAVVGGTFPEQRLLLDTLGRSGTTICVAGPLAATLFRSRSRSGGASLSAEAEQLGPARSWLERAEDAGTKIYFPFDVTLAEGDGQAAAPLAETTDPSRILDLGPRASEHFGALLASASAGIVTGALGSGAGDETARCVSLASAGAGFIVVVPDPEMPQPSQLDAEARARLGFVSNAGQAFIALFRQQKLAGVDALRRSGAPSRD